MRAPSNFMLAALALGLTRAFAADPATAGFVTDSSGNPVVSSTDRCWRNSSWTPGMAGACRPEGRMAAGSPPAAAGARPALEPAMPADSLAGASSAGAGAASVGAGLTDSSGQPIRNGFGDCWGTGFASPDPACGAAASQSGVASAAAPAGSASTTTRPGTSGSAALAAGAVAGAAAGDRFAPAMARGNPGYLTDSSGMVVRGSQGECWRTGSWSPGLATVVGCDGVLARATPVPAPAPSPTPVPLPQDQAAPAQPDIQSAPAAVPPPPTAGPLIADTPSAVPIPPAAAPTPPAVAPQTTPRRAPRAVVPTPPPVVAPADIAPRAEATPSPAPADTEPRTEKVTLETDTYFDFDKAALKPAGKRKLDELASRLANTELEVVVATGHTDWTGTDAYNRGLSERRARAVKNYLTEKGLPSGRIFTEGKGEQQPVATNKTREGRAMNRRVEVEVVGTRRTPANR